VKEKKKCMENRFILGEKLLDVKDNWGENVGDYEKSIGRRSAETKAGRRENM